MDRARSGKGSATPGGQEMRKTNSIVTTLCLCAISIVPMSAVVAGPVLQRVQTRVEGNSTLVQIEFDQQIPQRSGTWSIVEPPRLVLDFPETSNGTGLTHEAVASGEIKSYNVAQTDAQTRLVLNLYRPTQYTVEKRDRTLLVRLEQRGGALTDQSVGRRPAQSQSDPSLSAKLLSSAAVVRDIRFQRADDGGALIRVELSDNTIPVDIRRDGNSLHIELPGTELPQSHRLRRDVNDFATPVSTLTSRAMPGGSRLEIAARGRWFHQSRLTNSELWIEVKPIPADDANKLVQGGQAGQKVSINFFEAEATMVLRTLAEISGRNVMIDPSLSGRRITVTLDNIPYDQALDIVMAQVNASMRVTDTIVLFGDRNVLLKRDQDKADDLAKAADIAPLVSETFDLNYLKAADVASLILSAPSSGPEPISPSGSQPSGQGGQATQAAQAKGMLSSRGSVTRHDPTNKLFVRDTEERLAAIRNVIRSVDVPAKQVLIEARIVRADTTFSRNIGVRLGFNDLKNTVGRGVGTRIPGTDGYVAFGTTSSGLQVGTGQTVGGGVAPTAPFSGPSVNLPVAAGNSFAVSVFNSELTKFLNLELQAAEAEGKTVNIASPRVVTANNLEAKIAQGQKIPYSTVSSSGTNTQFVDATLSLTTKPQIAPNGTVILELKVTNNTAGTGSPPPINTAELNTKVTVENGGTVVLGGVVLEEATDIENRIPLLGDIPYLGNLFKSREKLTRKGELLVFITPRILNDTGVAIGQ